MRNPLNQFSKWLTSEFVMYVLVICSRMLFAEYLLAFLVCYVMADGLKGLNGVPLGVDFLGIYSAGTMANSGLSHAVYNWEAHWNLQRAIVGFASTYYAWSYPPPFLLVARLLALVPYLWSFGIYITASFFAYWFVMRRLILPRKELIWVMLAFPGVFCNLSNGQNGFITATLLGAGLLWLKKQPWLAGIMFGLLIFKPQFFVVTPLVLLVTGNKQAFLVTIVTALVAVLLSGVILGWEVWQAFLVAASGTIQHVVLEQGISGWHRMQSTFSCIRMWGGSVPEAYAAQTIVGAPVLLLTLWIWRGQASWAVRATALCGTILLMTPYVMDYDLVILAIPIAGLMCEGIDEGFFPYEKIILMLLWLLPFWARYAASFYVPLTPPLLITLMGLCVLKTRRLRLYPPLATQG